MGEVLDDQWYQRAPRWEYIWFYSTDWPKPRDGVFRERERQMREVEIAIQRAASDG